MCINLFGGLLWISINSQSYKWGATLDLVKIEILESRGYFGLGGGLLWRGATLDRSSLTVQTVYIFLNVCLSPTHITFLYILGLIEDPVFQAIRRSQFEGG